MLSAEQEAAIREVAATATAQAPAVVVFDPLSIRDLLAVLDATREQLLAARAENARLREWLVTCRNALDSFAGIAPIPDRPSLRILKEKP